LGSNFAEHFFHSCFLIITSRLAILDSGLGV
jgi:hypothetical protein